MIDFLESIIPYISGLYTLPWILVGFLLTIGIAKITGREKRQAFNFLIQGYSADMIRMAMTKVYEIAKNNPKWELQTVATVHDEAIYEVKEEFIPEASKAIKEAFESVTTFSVPIIADVSYGNNYGEAK